MPSVEDDLRIPENASEIVRNPRAHLVEVQNCAESERLRNFSDASRTHKHPYSIRICTKVTEKPSRRHQPEQTETTKLIT